MKLSEQWKDKKIKIALDEGNGTFFYTGTIISEDSKFLIFNDRKNGEMTINKEKISKIEGVYK